MTSFLTQPRARFGTAVSPSTNTSFVLFDSLLEGCSGRKGPLREDSNPVAAIDFDADRDDGRVTGLME